MLLAGSLKILAAVLQQSYVNMRMYIHDVLQCPWQHTASSSVSIGPSHKTFLHMIDDIPI